MGTENDDETEVTETPATGTPAGQRLQDLWDEVVPNSRLARDTARYNAAFAAKEALKAALKTLD
ncbi:MAG: hypothetical protein HY055_18080 [Magnetospirillum sp.]|nr:hypothetical protein [Magnetospirillum sp.]